MATEKQHLLEKAKSSKLEHDRLLQRLDLERILEAEELKRLQDQHLIFVQRCRGFEATKLKFQIMELLEEQKLMEEARQIVARDSEIRLESTLRQFREINLDSNETYKKERENKFPSKITTPHSFRDLTRIQRPLPVIETQELYQTQPDPDQNIYEQIISGSVNPVPPGNIYGYVCPNQANPGTESSLAYQRLQHPQNNRAQNIYEPINCGSLDNKNPNSGYMTVNGLNPEPVYPWKESPEEDYENIVEVLKREADQGPDLGSGSWLETPRRRKWPLWRHCLSGLNKICFG